ncbi:SMI1/KNR4 family protein [Deinococcus radiomollis]|uniref:SMI1/KNR4 family protein n=1 Tax=Deinococcus radiomollis TaxID=468916 RepID=UPI0038922E46
MTAASDLNDVLNRFSIWLASELPEVLAALLPGATEAQLNAFEARIGQPLPSDVRALYSWRNGQEQDNLVTGPFFGLTFLPLPEVARQWTGWQEVLAGMPELGEPDDEYTSKPAGAVQQIYISSGWIPFAYDHGGNHLGIDLTPGPAGTSGQIINFGRDEYDRVVLAASMSGFLEWLVSQYETGNFLIEDEGDGERSLNTRTPASRHFLDAVRTMF